MSRHDFRFDEAHLFRLIVRTVVDREVPVPATVLLYRKESKGQVVPIWDGRRAHVARHEHLFVLPGGEYLVELTTSDSAMNVVRLFSLRHDLDLQIALQPSVEAVIEVMDGVSRVRNAPVRILNSDGHDLGARVRGWQISRLHTDGAGMLLLPGVSPGSYRLITARGHGRFEVPTTRHTERHVVQLER
jgi:hypothetical protein